MNAKRFSYVMCVILVLLVISAGAAVVVSSDYLRAKAEQVAALKVELAGAEARESAYIKSRNELSKYAALKARVDKILPQDKDQARAIKELFAIAEESGIRITQITFPNSELGAVAKKPAATPGGNAAKPAVTPTTVTQAEPIEGVTGVLGIATSLEVDPISPSQPITYERFIEFLRKLELNRRTMQVSQVTITPIEKNAGGKFDFSVNLTIFVKP